MKHSVSSFSRRFIEIISAMTHTTSEYYVRRAISLNVLFRLAWFSLVLILISSITYMAAAEGSCFQGEIRWFLSKLPLEHHAPWFLVYFFRELQRNWNFPRIYSKAFQRTLEIFSDIPPSIHPDYLQESPGIHSAVIPAVHSKNFFRTFCRYVIKRVL